MSKKDIYLAMFYPQARKESETSLQTKTHNTFGNSSLAKFCTALL
jgi:hypothetical protein